MLHGCAKELELLGGDLVDAIRAYSEHRRYLKCIIQEANAAMLRDGIDRRVVKKIQATLAAIEKFDKLLTTEP